MNNIKTDGSRCGIPKTKPTSNEALLFQTFAEREGGKRLQRTKFRCVVNLIYFFVSKQDRSDLKTKEKKVNKRKI